MPIFQTTQTPLYGYFRIVRLLMVEVFWNSTYHDSLFWDFRDTHTERDRHTHLNQTKNLVIMATGFRVGKNNDMLRGSCVKVCVHYSNSHSIGLLSKSFSSHLPGNQMAICRMIWDFWVSKDEKTHGLSGHCVSQMEGMLGIEMLKHSFQSILDFASSSVNNIDPHLVAVHSLPNTTQARLHWVFIIAPVGWGA